MAARKTAAAEPPAAAGWDAFWAEVNAKDAPTEVIRGITVAVPSDLPLGFQQRVAQLQNSDRDEDVRELVGRIFGEGILDQWIAADMGAREFKIVMAWGIANGSGKPTSFHEAYDIVTAAEAEGKEASAPQPNRAARRAASTKASSASGGASKRTSSASTRSARTTSRA